MNLPNFLSLFRIVAGPVVPFLLVLGDDLLRITAFVLFLFCAFTDWFDGWYARKFNQITSLGKILDPIADKVMVLSLLFGFAFLQMYSVWFVVVIALREIIVTIVRLNLVKKGEVVAAEMSGKIKTTLQMVSLFYFSVYFYFLEYQGQALAQGNLNIFLGSLMYALLWLSVFITLYSGYEFFVNNKKIIFAKKKKK